MTQVETLAKDLPSPNKRSAGKGKRRDLIFYILMIALPVLQFCIFYIGVNFNSVLLAFRKFDRAQNDFLFVGFDNISNFFREFTESMTLQNAALNSVKVWALCTVITMPLALFFSFFIYKKIRLEGLFKFALFLPSIIPGIVTVIIFQYFVERAVPAVADSLFHREIMGLLANPDTQFGTLLFYNIFYGFGSYMLLFTGAMNTVDVSVREAAELDGAEGMREFVSIVLPKVFPTLTTFLVLSVAGIFTNQFALYSFYGIEASGQIGTFGYYLYSVTSVATYAEYPRLAAMGVVLTVIVVPFTLGVKALFERVGYRE